MPRRFTIQLISGLLMSASIALGIPMTNLSIWLDAADLDADGTPDTNGIVSVAQWNNKAGNGINFAQANTAIQPTRQTNALNGQPGVLFSSDYLTAADPGANSAVDITDKMHFFAVVTSDGSLDGILSKGGAGGGSSTWIVEVGMADRSSPSSVDVYLGNNGWKASQTDVVPANTPVILEISFDATLASDNVCFIVNGQPQGTATATTALQVNDLAVYVGNQSGLNPMSGFIGDLLLYKGTLDDNGRNQAGYYLQSKYGITGDYLPEPGGALLVVLATPFLCSRRLRGRQE